MLLEARFPDLAAAYKSFSGTSYYGASARHSENSREVLRVGCSETRHPFHSMAAAI